MSVLIKSKLSNDSVSFLLPVETPHADPEINTVVKEMPKSDEPNVPEMATYKANDEVDLESEVIAEDVAAEALAPSINQDEIDALKKIAKEEGYREGYQEALEDVKSQYTTKLETLESIASSLNDAVPDYLKQSEQTIAAIVFSALSKIIGDTLSDQTKSLAIVKETIRALDYQEIREVLVSQSDFDAIQSLADDFLADAQSDTGTHLAALNIKPDPTITLGGCKVKLMDGYLNATIQNQLDALANALTAKVESLENES